MRMLLLNALGQELFDQDELIYLALGSRKGHHYYACDYLREYGDAAAIQAHGGQKWIY